MCALRTKLIVLQRFLKKYERKKKGRNKNSLLLGHIVMITAINKKIKQVCASFMNLIMPRECPVCGKRMMPTEETMCIGCMSMLPTANLEDSRDNGMIRLVWPGTKVEHGLCLFYYRSHNAHQRPVMQFKYMKNAKLARTMGQLAATVIAEYGIEKEIDGLVPVPLSWRRHLERGYNQAEWLAQGIAETFRLPVHTKLLKRTEHRRQQTRLNREERKENAEGLYRATIPEQMKGRHFLIVDDVCTTGATLSACAKAIKEADPSACVSIFALAWVGE